MTTEKPVQGRPLWAEYEQQKDGQWTYDAKGQSCDPHVDVKVDPDKVTVIASTRGKLAAHRDAAD